MMKERVAAELPVLWEALLPHQYAEWFSGENLPPLPLHAAERCPTERALVALSESGTRIFNDQALTHFIARAPGGFFPLLSPWCRRGNEAELARVLSLAPREASAGLAQALPPAKDLLQMRPGLVHTVRTFLTRATRARHPQFEVCYRALLAIERGVGPLRQLT
jgi:hypothetical protein